MTQKGENVNGEEVQIDNWSSFLIQLYTWSDQENYRDVTARVIYTVFQHVQKGMPDLGTTDAFCSVLQRLYLNVIFYTTRLFSKWDEV